jgi:pimeloyl-ACP methyl ester carboxylesterase
MPPRVVFFPGASGAADFWAPVAGRMPPGWQTRLLSWPGAGTEPPDPEINAYGDLVERAAASVPDGSDVVAQSMGGVVAVGLALAYPRKIRRLVLVAASGGLDLGRLGAEDWRPGYEAEFPDAAPWVTGQRVDHTQELQDVEIPTCLIWGDEDPVSPLSVGETLDRALPNSGLHVVRGGTHTVARERPVEVAQLIIEHLS